MVHAIFLKLKYRSAFMIAVSQDGNNNIFSLAFGITDSENNESYNWFFNQLRNTIGVDPIDATRFIVRKGGVEYIVDLKSRTCQCLIFQTDEIPCTHAIATINSRYMNKFSYCSPWFSGQSWLQTYQGEILPVGSTTSWIVPGSIKDLITKPPYKEVLLGRRQISRYLCSTEYSRNNYRCSRCKRIKHNRSNCHYTPTIHPYARRYRKKNKKT
ncbi:hypothetical protein P3S68_004104 [Capsicum galapagoense]